MEWVETTGKTIEAARESALDKLGVHADEAEFDVIEEPKPGLFGRMRGEARLRARVRPTQVRPKQDRRRRNNGKESGRDTESVAAVAVDADAVRETSDSVADDRASEPTSAAAGAPRRNRRPKAKSDAEKANVTPTADNPEAPTGSAGPDDTTADHRDQPGEDRTMSSDTPETPSIAPDEVGAAAVQFMDGLTAAFGLSGTATLTVDDLELDVAVSGSELGLLVGPGGRTLNAIQDLARVAAQRRLGDHDTRLRIDVAGYRARREAALAAFARQVADEVRSTGTARALEPMVSADRKVVHDALNDEDGVVSRSVGDDPGRRIVIEPA